MKVLTEAVRRDEFARSRRQFLKVRKGDISQKIKAFIQNVHHFRHAGFDLFQQYGVRTKECAPIVAALLRKPEAGRDSMMRFELGLGSDQS